MKHIIVIIYLVSQAIWGVSQTTLLTGLSPSEKYRCFYVTLEEKNSQDTILLPVSKIYVHDVRQDTSKLGFFKSGRTAKITKYCFVEGSGVELTRFANTYLHFSMNKSMNDEVHMFIRKLWISRVESLVKIDQTNFSQVYLKAEFYLKHAGNYYPLIRFDSAVNEKRFPSDYSSKLVEELIIRSLEKLKHTNFAKAMERPSFQITEINKRNQSTHYINSDTLVKGVYLNFSEFRANKPSIRDFNIEFEPAVDMLYVKDEDGKYYSRPNVWGFSDGNIAFIKIGANFLPLFKQNNTWEFYYHFLILRRFILPTLTTSPAAILASMFVSELSRIETVKLKKAFPLQLDMETGEIY